MATKTKTQATAPITRDDETAIRQRAYSDYERYLANAKETLKKANKRNGYYTDAKYVKAACGIAYSGVLLVLDAWIAIKGETYQRPRNGRRSIDYYRQNVKRNTRLLNALNVAYEVLHLSGYYEGILKATTIDDGLDTFSEIAEYVKPKS